MRVQENVSAWVHIDGSRAAQRPGIILFMAVFAVCAAMDNATQALIG